ncbi:MAG: substrate-binding domain-containing protein [Planctomycetes bacterium]|nr:substrate-binding domain-containing protein [Planctomycetota bacterium]
MLRALALVAVSSLLAACGSDQPATTDKPVSGDATAAPRVAVIPKGTTHVFWQAVAAGAKDAGARTGLNVVWKGPLQENDRAQQIQLVQQFVSEGVAGIALAPLDHAALAPVVRSAKNSGIPVVIFDSDLDGTPGVDFASFVATDNRAGGELAGQRLAELVGGKGKVVLLRYQVGSASTEAREAGFLAAAKAAGLEVLVDNRYAGATIGEAKNTALNLADHLQQAHGVFCSNESATAGMLQALDQLGLRGKVRFVGFDSSPPLVDGLRDGGIDALVVQDPRKMGELSVQALADLIAKKPVAPKVDTGAVLATKANMDEPAVKRLLQ